MLGKSTIITDNHDWSTAEIVQAHLDRWQVEDAFRSSKAPDLIGVQPKRHWTDSKIRCHLFTCVATLTDLRRLEQPNHTQSEVPTAFAHTITPGGVLQHTPT